MLSKLLNILAASLVLAGCSAELADVSDNVGYLAVDLVCEAEGLSKSVEVDPSSLDITISGPVTLSCKCAELPSVLELEPGFYTISVSSSEAEPAAFDQPIYGGSTGFEISAGITTSVKLVCKMLNMKVTINPSAAFLEQVSSYNVSVNNGYGELVWTEEDVEAGMEGYFSVAPLAISLRGYSLGNTGVSYDGIISDVEASDHHIINLGSF